MLNPLNPPLIIPPIEVGPTPEDIKSLIWSILISFFLFTKIMVFYNLTKTDGIDHKKFVDKFKKSIKLCEEVYLGTDPKTFWMRNWVEIYVDTTFDKVFIKPKAGNKDIKTSEYISQIDKRRYVIKKSFYKKFIIPVIQEKQ